MGGGQASVGRASIVGEAVRAGQGSGGGGSTSGCGQFSGAQFCPSPSQHDIGGWPLPPNPSAFGGVERSQVCAERSVSHRLTPKADGSATRGLLGRQSGGGAAACSGGRWQRAADDGGDSGGGDLAGRLAGGVGVFVAGKAVELRDEQQPEGRKQTHCVSREGSGSNTAAAPAFGCFPTRAALEMMMIMMCVV